MVNNLINNLFADFIHVAKVMNYTYNATIQPFIDRGIILIYSAIKGSIDNAKNLIHIGLMSDSLFTG